MLKYQLPKCLLSLLHRRSPNSKCSKRLIFCGKSLRGRVSSLNSFDTKLLFLSRGSCSLSSNENWLWRNIFSSNRRCPSKKSLISPKNFLISKLSYGWGFRRTMENILLLKFKISTMFCCIFSSHLSQEYKSYQLLQYCPCYKEHDKKYKLSQRVEQSLLQIKEAKRCVSLGKKDWCYNGVVTEHLYNFAKMYLRHRTIMASALGEKQ